MPIFDSERLLYKWTVRGRLFKKCQHHNGPQHRTKRKKIDRFGAVNWVNSCNFIAVSRRYSEKFDHTFRKFFIFGNMFPESHGFVAVTSSNNFISHHKLDRNTLENVALIQLMTSNATKPQLSGNLSGSIGNVIA